MRWTDLFNYCLVLSTNVLVANIIVTVIDGHRSVTHFRHTNIIYNKLLLLRVALLFFVILKLL